MRQRKVHRFGFVAARAGSQMLKTSKRSEAYAACGVWLRQSRPWLLAVSDATFTHLPIEAQCRNRRLNEPRAFRSKWQRITEATDAERTIVELVCHAFGSFCAAVDESGTHADRGCYLRFDGKGVPTCWCGMSSWMFAPIQRLLVESEGDKLLRGIGWWPEREWRSKAGDEYVTARVHGAERVP